MNCRLKCGACCIAPSITSAIPGMLDGKPANTPCIQLDMDNNCKLFGSSKRPAVCGGLKPSEEMCGTCQEDALKYLAELEKLTAPSGNNLYNNRGEMYNKKSMR